ncbi:MAG: glycoside hydrolase family 5 protein [Polyangiaceae bacterium]|nr:glycoside hydrolase family 5 protein [Polyangiaceae bacterium]
MSCRRALPCRALLPWSCFIIAAGAGVGCGSAGSPAGGSDGAGGLLVTGGSPAGGGTTASSSPAEGGTTASSSATGGNAAGGTGGYGTGGGGGAGTSATSAGGDTAPSSSGGRAVGGSVGSSGASSSGGGAQSLGGTTASGGSAAGTGGSPSGGSSGASGGSAGSATDPAAPEPFTPGKPPAAAAHFMKGINLGNRLEAPNEGDWGGEVLAGDFPFIAQRGFDHVRIPIRFSGHALSSAPYTIDAAFFARIDTVLDQATAASLAVIVDMHAYDEMASNPSGERERFLALWSQIAARYKDRPDDVAFELLNEPNTELDSMWNDVAAAAITTVRATNPRRLLVVDTVFWADPAKLSALTLPNDANLLVAVHLYEPKLFSFQGKSWIGEEYMTTGVIFPGPPSTPITPVAAASAASWAKQWFDKYNTLPEATNPSGPATITAQVGYVTSYRQSQGRTVYNGEWGPQDGGAMESRVRLVTEVRKQCEEAGVGWAIWEDPTNMQLFDSTAGTWVTPIVDALLP